MTTATRGIGDNCGPSLADVYFIEWASGVIFSDMKLVAKIITLAAVILQTSDPFELAKAVNVSPKSVERHKGEPAKKGWLHVPPLSRRGGRGVRCEFLPGHPDHQKIPINLVGVDWRKYRPLLDANIAKTAELNNRPCDKTPDSLGVVSEETPVNLGVVSEKNPRQLVQNPRQQRGDNLGGVRINQ
jgi:hypothetical protein